MSKGSKRRPEDKDKIDKNWPFPRKLFPDETWRTVSSVEELISELDKELIR